ncbi:P1 family peptidase [Curvibacter sp. RS43]|nr:P1 family peptidase [Curvibacter sp. RS43]MDD0810126.1 P1 family peptidase [Curvibacter sp. RS43]
MPQPKAGHAPPTLARHDLFTPPTMPQATPRAQPATSQRKAPQPAAAKSATAAGPAQPQRTPRRRGPGSITDVPGIEVGHFTDERRPTGCTVVMAREGAVAGVDVRGAAPGTRETDLLDPSNLVQQVHAIVLAGGSAWGLDAASGAVRWLEEQGVGFNVGVGRLPIVPAAVLFDLLVGDMRIRPDAAAGYAACAAASTRRPAEGNVGAGTGAAVGKIFGIHRAMKGGIGTASVTVDGVTVGALVACNALGDVLDPDTGRVLAGARTANGRRLLDTRRALLRGEPPKPLLPGTNTTLGVIATDAPLTKAQAQRLAVAGQDGLARSINPVHTLSDGDTVFALATGRADHSPGMMVLATMAAEAMARATVRAVLAARGLRTAEGLHLPAALDLAPPPDTGMAPDLTRQKAQQAKD